MKNITSKNKVFSNQDWTGLTILSAFKSQEVEVSGLGKYCNATHVLNVLLAVSIRSLAI